MKRIPLTGSVLAAVVPGTEDRVRAMLPDCELTFVSTYGEAVAALQNKRHDGVVIGMRFDESRMLDLLRHVRRTHPETPVVCIQTTKSNVLSNAVRAATAMVVGLLGAQAMFDQKVDTLKQKDPAPLERKANGNSGDDELRR